MRQQSVTYVLYLALLTLALAAPGRAAVWYVKAGFVTTMDDGMSWATAFRSIPNALGRAAPGDEVWVAAGTYAGRIELSDRVALYGGFAGTEARRDERDFAAHETVIDAQLAGPVVTVTPGAAEGTVVDGFTLRNGASTYENRWAGGGVHSVGASPVIRNNRIVDNQGQSAGRAIYCEGGSPRIEGNTITGNRWRAIDCRQATVTIAGNTIRDNAVAPFWWHSLVPETAYLGAVSLWESTATVTGNTITGNAFYFESGEYPTAGGGGLFCGDSIVIAERNVISGNLVSAWGATTGRAIGGGVMMSGGTVRLANNLIVGNVLKAGGYAVTAQGAGVYQEGGALELANNTIADNTLAGQDQGVPPWKAIMEGGVYLDLAAEAGASCAATNNILAFNTGGLHGTGPAPAWSHNDVFDNGQDYPPDRPDPTGTDGNISADPLFVNRASGDFHLQALSPCIEAGENLAAMGEYDLDGRPRVQGGRMDMGAYEWFSSPKTMADVARALRISAGLVASDAGDRIRLDVAQPPSQIDLRDAVRLARKAAGLDANP